MEIERKWLMTNRPQGLPLRRRALVEQGYLCVKPAVRIRRSQEEGRAPSYVLCIKGKGTLVREEVEFAMTQEQFDRLARLLEKPLIRKDFWVFELPGGLLLEYSEVDRGAPGAFAYAEVEFASEQAARAFAAPAFLGREVTEEAGWSMASYWARK